jgi:hypothetical protein
MRVLQISGLLLVAIGLWIIIRVPSYPHEQSVLKVGGLEAKVQEQRPVPGWAGGMALGAGLVLLVVGFRKS